MATVKQIAPIGQNWVPKVCFLFPRSWLSPFGISSQEEQISVPVAWTLAQLTELSLTGNMRLSRRACITSVS